MVLAAAVSAQPVVARALAGRIVQVTVGGSHSCGLGSDGTAYCWGQGANGQLGNGDTADQLAPVAVDGPAGVTFTRLTAASNHTCGLGDDGTAYCWGQGLFGQLGNGGTADRLTPVAVDAPAGVTFTQLTAATNHSCGLGDDGSAYCWGNNSNYQLGNGGQLGAGGSYTLPTPVLVNAPAAGVTFTQLTAGSTYTCGLGSDSTAYCWGQSGDGQLGIGGGSTTQASPVAVDAPAGVTFTQLSAGSGGPTCGVGDDGQAYCWGFNAAGQLGNGDTETQYSPMAVNAPAGVTFTHVSAASNYSCGLAGDGGAYCWGSNDSGQLGDGSTADKLSPVAVDAPSGVTFTQLDAGYTNACGLGSDDAVYCWGTNDHGQLGDGGTTNQSSPVAVPLFAPASSPSPTPSPSPSATPSPAPGGSVSPPVAQLAAGDYHTCALSDDDQAYCWGAGTSGQLGDGATVSRSHPVAVSAPAGVTFTQLTAGWTHTCGLGSDDAAYCWGSNLRGELGVEGATNRLTPAAVSAPAGVTFTQVTTREDHTCGLGSDTTAYCWGPNTRGELGVGDTAPRSVPVAVSAPAGVTFTQLTAGWFHTCGLGDDAKAYCWGANGYSQLGVGDTTNRSIPVAVSAPAGVTFTQLTAGWTQTCGLGNDSKAYCWGSNNHAVAGVQFGHGPVDVRLGGHRADHHVGGDLIVGQPTRGQRHGLAFAGGQPGQHGVPIGLRGLGDVPVDQFAGDRRCQQRVAAGRDADGVQKVLRQDVLDEEAGRSGTERLEHVLVQPVVGQDDDVHPVQSRVRGDAPGGLDAVDARHPDVEENDVGPMLPGQRDSVVAVARLGHDLEVVLGVEQSSEAAADQRLVVDQQDPDHDVPSTGSSAWTVKPPSSRGSARSSPPRAVTRSRIPSRPTPGTDGVRGMAIPSSSTWMTTAPGW
ncbi:hypothetical protein Apa02nite_089900 [Actinoplanes palleronii]|uniref:RCC1-like domain-containing protein n=1 Tax=Actinoplanes palleronii TaxID=113570 RepID=A0ABQ4BQH8_9ACTN|nr:hypothetical protein Apa02nite_089900 [Actinoplanes palleronii]